MTSGGPVRHRRPPAESPDVGPSPTSTAGRSAADLAAESGVAAEQAASTAERVDRLGNLTEAMAQINAAADFDALVAAAAVGLGTIFPDRAVALALRPDGWCRLAVVDGPDGAVVTRIVASDLLDRLGDHADQLTDDLASAVLTAATWSAEVPSTPMTEEALVTLCHWQPDSPPVCLVVAAGLADDPEQRELLWQLSRTFALAVGGLRSFAAEHSLALTLQRSLLPSLLPRNPDFDMAVRYVPASHNAEIGGDFYEVTELGSALLVAIGDVTGHSIKAATIMGEVRHALRAFAIEGHPPDVILDLLNRMMLKYHADFCVTMCLLLVDTVTGETAVANAGHIPPLLIDQDGARFASVQGPLLGIGLPRPEPTMLRLPVGATVVLVTDGLLEDRVTAIDEAMAALAEAAATPESGTPAEQDLEELCERLLERFGHDKDDDIALLTLRRRDPDRLADSDDRPRID